jgi:hypothetical protein
MPPRKKQRAAPGAASSAAAAISSSASTAFPAPLLTRRYPLRLNPSQPHQKLHRHALESIFAFLSFDELRLAMFVSRDWLSAVYSIRGLEKGATLTTKHPGTSIPAAVLTSRLARHVTSIGTNHWRAFVVSQAELEQAIGCMPFLQQLSLKLKSGDDWSQLRLPATLHTISLVLPAEISAAVANGLISALCQHERLVSLSLRFSAPIPTAVSLAPLQSLPALIELGLIDLQSDDVPFLQLSPEQAQQVRTLTQLQRLTANLDEATLLQLMQPPRNSQLEWTEWPCEFYCSAITDAVAALMPSLPNLHTLVFNASFCRMRSLGFLAQLPRLTSFHRRFLESNREQSTHRAAAGSCSAAAADHFLRPCQRQ